MSLLFLASFVGGCVGEAIIPLGSPPEAPGDGPIDLPETSVPSARFTGTWLIEETVPHATYSASMWEFADDGSLTLVQDFSIDGTGYPSVSWAGSRESVCTFGDRWTSPDDQTLQIAALCTEGAAEMEIVFDANQATNTISVVPTSVSVDGNTDMWSEPYWGWHFVKCEGDFSNCTPQTL